jgi:hypothetical protein
MEELAALLHATWVTARGRRAVRRSCERSRDIVVVIVRSIGCSNASSIIGYREGRKQFPGLVKWQ